MAAAFVSKAGFAPLVRRAHPRRDVSVVRRHRAAPRCVSTVRVGATGGSEAPTTEAAQMEAYVETEEELRERRAVGELVAWCVSRGAAGSGLSVLLPDGTGRGRGLEASRALAKGEPVLRLPLEMGICDYQDGHPADAWETMSNAPWGVRLACRLLQERAKGDDSEWAPYLTLVPAAVPGSPLLYSEEQVLALQYPPAVAEAKEMREAVTTWHAKLLRECPSSLAGADHEAFAAAVSVVHSRTYGVASSEGQGFFRALLPLADLLNHGGDEYPEEASAAGAGAGGSNEEEKKVGGDGGSGGGVKWPPAGCTDNIAWSELDDDGSVEFAATRDVAPGEEVLMSYGERSNDHFLLYYGFVPRRNPHDDVILFSDVDHALSWHVVYHPELWDDATAEAREAAARAAVRQVELGLEDSSDGALVKAEPRLKVLPGGRCDARLVSLFAAAYAGTDEGVAAGGPVMQVDIDSAHADVARRCAELLRGMPTTLEEDYAVVAKLGGEMGGGSEEQKEEEKEREEGVHGRYAMGKQSEKEKEVGAGPSAGTATAVTVAYRAHKKEVLVDAIENFGRPSTS